MINNKQKYTSIKNDKKSKQKYTNKHHKNKCKQNKETTITQQRCLHLQRYREGEATDIRLEEHGKANGKMSILIFENFWTV